MAAPPVALRNALRPTSDSTVDMMCVEHMTVFLSRRLIGAAFYLKAWTACLAVTCGKSISVCAARLK